MKKSTKDFLDKMISKYLFLPDCKESIVLAAQTLIECFEENGKLLLCGNGGSAADADHIVGELAKGFLKHRPLGDEIKHKLCTCGVEGKKLAEKLQMGFSAINLSAHNALITAIMNDIGKDEIFAQQVLVYGVSRDILLGISTSGNSPNVLKAGLVAKALGMKTVLLTGQNESGIMLYFDVKICVPSRVTWEIQDMHSTVYHIICAAIEEEFLGK